MADVHMTDQGGPFTHLDELVRFANSTIGPDTTNPTLLDLRCGTGSLIRAFAPSGWEAVGVDASAQLTAKAASLQPESMPAEFVVGNTAESIDLRERQFDLIVGLDDLAVTLLDAVQLEAFLGRTRDLLKPGGHLIFQLERTTAFSSIDAKLHEIARAGFENAWRATPAHLAHPISSDLDHRGTRDIFVARKNRH